MRKSNLILILTITLSFLSACGDSPDELLGTWKMTTDDFQTNIGLEIMTSGEGVYVIIEKKSITVKIGNLTETVGVKKYRKRSRNNWEILYDDGTIDTYSKVGNTLQYQGDNGMTVILTREN
jgi:hypothetical protein